MGVNYIVAGFYTPDYARWWGKLRENLDFWSQPHDFAIVEKAAGGWEVNTRLKAPQVLAAMDRHPGKTVIFIDVDCEVRGDLSELARTTKGDIGIHFHIKLRSKGARLRPRCGTLVVRPTPAARRFVEAWIEHCIKARIGDNDQTCFILAMHSTNGITIEPLDSRWCVVPDGPTPENAVIVHDSASLSVKRMSRLTQLTKRLFALCVKTRQATQGAPDQHPWRA